MRDLRYRVRAHERWRELAGERGAGRSVLPESGIHEAICLDTEEGAERGEMWKQGWTRAEGLGDAPDGYNVISHEIVKEDPVAALLVRSAELEGGREVRTRRGVRVEMDAA